MDSAVTNTLTDAIRRELKRMDANVTNLSFNLTSAPRDINLLAEVRALAELNRVNQLLVDLSNNWFRKRLIPGTRAAD